MLDQAFNVEGLHELRETVLAHATAAGMPESRATEVMLVAHELASNAILHGGGTGWLRIRTAAGALHCQVTDPGIARSDGHPPRATPDPATTVSAPQPQRWPTQRGHGLWLIRQAADHFSVITGPHGSQVDVSFNLPGTF